MRLHIIGGGGSGKSYIARQLSARCRIPTLDLDDIYWDRGAVSGTANAAEKRDAALAEFVQAAHWIVEGMYYRWVGPSFERADLIVVLVPPLWLRQVRIVRRFARRKLGLEPDKKETIQGLVEFLKWNRHYDGDNLARALALLDILERPYIRCASLAEVEAALKERNLYPIGKERA